MSGYHENTWETLKIHWKNFQNWKYGERKKYFPLPVGSNGQRNHVIALDRLLMQLSLVEKKCINCGFVINPFVSM